MLNVYIQDLSAMFMGEKYAVYVDLCYFCMVKLNCPKLVSSEFMFCFVHSDISDSDDFAIISTADTYLCRFLIHGSKKTYL